MNEEQKNLFEDNFSKTVDVEKYSSSKGKVKQQLNINPRLMQYLEKYIRAYSDRGKEIEIKGRLIDFIRKVH